MPPKRKRDFGANRKRKADQDPPRYDLAYDAVLIEQSIAAQYGVLPGQQGDLPWSEWAKLVAGLMDNTPLGRVVAVRAETDRKVIAKMTPWQKRIRTGWQRYLAGKQMHTRDPAELRREMLGLQKAMAKLFGGGKHA